MSKHNVVGRLFPSSEKNDLHHQRHRKFTQPGQKGGTQPWAFSQRSSGDEIDLSGLEKY